MNIKQVDHKVREKSSASERKCTDRKWQLLCQHTAEKHYDAQPRKLHTNVFINASANIRVQNIQKTL